MLDASANARFARCCSDAMFGYANATSAAYATMASQAFDIWASAVRSMMPGSTPRSWYRHPDTRMTMPVFTQPFVVTPLLPAQSPATAWLAPWSFVALKPQAGIDAMMGPWTTWLSMWSGPRVATAWPMAFAMVANGMPQSVAVPAAEAHAAVLDAATTAADHLTRIYSAYRSESGYASAQVIAPPRRQASSVTRSPSPKSIPVLPMWPWLLH